MHITVITLPGYTPEEKKRLARALKETIGEKTEGSGSIGGCRFLYRFCFHKGFTYGEMGHVYS